MKWIRSRAAKSAAPTGQNCIGCLAPIAGTTEEELFFSGGVFLAGAGWFCGARCESQYRIRFRIQPAATPSAGSATPSPVSRHTAAQTASTLTAEAAEPAAPARRPAVEELAEALRVRRRKLNNGF